MDNNVGTNRTSFDIPDTTDDDELSMKEIVSAVTESVQGYLSEYLDEVRVKKDERIRRYIRNEAPQFGHLIKYMPEAIAAIKPNLVEAKLDEELYKIKRRFDADLKRENQEILKTIDVGAENMEIYKEKFRVQIEKISEANKAALAEYVAHRKVILELLKKGINSNEFGKYSKEAYIHNLIYPMRRTSDEIEYQSHNLWLIDERLSYCDYISSDIPFNNDPNGHTDIG